MLHAHIIYFCLFKLSILSFCLINIINSLYFKMFISCLVSRYLTLKHAHAGTRHLHAMNRLLAKMWHPIRFCMRTMSWFKSSSASNCCCSNNITKPIKLIHASYPNTLKPHPPRRSFHQSPKGQTKSLDGSWLIIYISPLPASIVVSCPKPPPPLDITNPSPTT